jgi:hypothetical protein
MSPINILMMIHGMSPDKDVRSPFNSNGKFWGYDEFFDALIKQQPQLKRLFPASFTGLDGKPRSFIGVEWGHELAKTPVDQLEPDQRLMKAQNFLNDTIGYNQIKDYKNGPGKNDENQQIIWDFPPDPLRLVIFPLRENIITCGLGDVIYYTSKEGETQVRKRVYHQVLSQLTPFLSEPDIRLHLIGDSLGVTICHDFLFGLFTRGEESGYIVNKQFMNIEDSESFIAWSQKASPTVNQLKLGSITSTASQLPLFVMRKQELVDRLARGQQIDAKGIGVIDSNRIQWQLFHDIDDLLGFSTRRLYNCQNAIREVQVQSGNAFDAHTSYKQSKVVIEKTSELLVTNAQ